MDETDYIPAAKQCIAIALREDYMDDEEWEDYITFIFERTGNTWELVAEDIRKGVENGISVEDQIKVVKAVSAKYTDN